MARFKKAYTKTNYRALLRATAVVSAIVMLVGGATFAVLQSQKVTLQGNTIQTATANLSLSTTGFDYSTSQNGFNFTNLVPGGSAEPQAGNHIYLKNSGNVDLAIKLAATGIPSNPNNIDLNKVHIIITDVATSTVQRIPLQTLISAETTGGFRITSPAALGASGEIAHYTLQVAIDSDALNGPSATLNNLDLAFSGEAVVI